MLETEGEAWAQSPIQVLISHLSITMLLPQTCVLALINQEVEKHSEELWLKPQTIPTTASFSQIGSDGSRVAYRTVAMSVPRSGIISSSSQQRLLSAPRYRQSPRPPPSRCYVSGCLFRARSPCHLMACPPCSSPEKES